SSLDDGIDFAAAVNEAMANAAGTTIDELRTLPSNTKVLPESRSLSIEEAVAYNDGRVDCCPPSFEPVIARACELFSELSAEPSGTLKLIQWRNRRQHNTWGRRLAPRLREGNHARNPLFLHPDDAAARGLTEGDAITVRSVAGRVDTVVGLDDALLPGVVAL